MTAVVPLPLADVAAALASNLRMIRRVAEIYGGRSGDTRVLAAGAEVMTHLVATGAVAVGDDLIHGVAGGTVLIAPVAAVRRGRGERRADRAGRHRGHRGLPAAAVPGARGADA